MSMSRSRSGLIFTISAHILALLLPAPVIPVLSACQDALTKKKKNLCHLQSHLSPEAALNQMNSVFLYTLRILIAALSRYLQHFDLLYWSIALLFISPIRL